MGTHAEPVFFHELTHALHARLDNGLQTGQNAGQETVAELAAAVLMDMYGLKDHTGNAWNYISGYNADPLRAIMQATAKVGEILDVLFSDTVAN